MLADFMGRALFVLGDVLLFLLPGLPLLGIWAFIKEKILSERVMSWITLLFFGAFCTSGYYLITDPLGVVRPEAPPVVSPEILKTVYKKWQEAGGFAEVTHEIYGRHFWFTFQEIIINKWVDAQGRPTPRNCAIAFGARAIPFDPLDKSHFESQSATKIMGTMVWAEVGRICNWITK